VASSAAALARTARDAIAAIPVVDTHEHLLREETRRQGPGAHDTLPCADAALLFHHYAADDLASAGMPLREQQELFDPEVAPLRKWTLLEPWLRRSATTGFLRAVAETARLLFGEPELSAPAFARISERMLDPGWTAPGMTHRLLDAAGVDSCEVQSLEAHSFDRRAPLDPRVRQDICVDGYATRLNLDAVAREWGRPVHTLDDLDAALDSLFALRAGAAAAVKSCALYTRRLDVMGDDPAAAATALRSIRRHGVTGVDERRALEDHVLHRAFTRAAEHGLRVKLHTGMCAGVGNGRIGPAMCAAADVEPILQAHRDTTFVLMHAGWPAMDETIALAKTHPNAYVDLCWAWIVNPVACERFVVEYLAAAPAGKLLGFGGDHPIPETITGHLAIARAGLARALVRAVELGVARREDVPVLARMILRENALAVTSPLLTARSTEAAAAALGA
jgi:uncharacterized protein